MKFQNIPGIFHGNVITREKEFLFLTKYLVSYQNRSEAFIPPPQVGHSMRFRGYVD